MKKALLSHFAAISIMASVCQAEFQVNTHTTWDQKDPAIAMDAEGNFVVVWNSYRQDGDSGGVFAQRFDSNCAPIGPEFQVNITAADNQTNPSAAMNGAGDLVVVWQGRGASEEEIFAQRFDPNGKRVGAEFRINTYTDDSQLYPSVAVHDDGSFAVVWESQNIPEDNNNTSICAQLFDSSGNAVGSEFIINDTPGRCRYPDVAMDANGNFAVAWLRDATTNSIMARLYNHDAVAAEGPRQVNTEDFSTLTRPSIAMNSAGRFIIAWDGHPELGSLDDIHARLYMPSGSPREPQFTANTTRAGAQQNPKVAINSQGEFVIVWNSETGLGSTERDIFGQRFDSSCTTIGDEFQVNTFTGGDQRYADVALRETGAFVTVWQSDEQDGSGFGIFGQIVPAVGSADFTGDGIVNFRDFCILAAEWRKDENPLTADLTDDNRINEQDLAAFCQRWLTP
jgi:hypothetical protein